MEAAPSPGRERINFAAGHPADTGTTKQGAPMSTTTAPQTGAEAPVKLSEAAAKEIRKIIADQELDASKIRLRVGVKGGGCSGFSYLLDLTEAQKETDEVFEIHGIKVICDPKSLLYLGGVTIDFRDEIMGRGFVFNNPNASGTCGCGSSFHV
jgi:iron-sulfur cluster assembly protein